MRYTFASIALCLGIAPALAAQDKPSAAMMAAISGTWKIDASHSDAIPDNPLSGARGLGAIQGGNSSHAGASGGGGGGGGGGRGARAASPPPIDAGSAGSSAPANGGDGGQGMGRGGGNPNMRLILAEVNPGAGIVIGANDSIVAIATANMIKAAPGSQSNWKTDGKKHGDAQMDGTVMEAVSSWKDNTLTITYAAVGVGSFKREFKTSKDGQTLELKETVESGGRKAEYKLVFTR